MTFDHLRYFLAIVECNSFSHAAENLYISQSSLSKQIKTLENELQQPLFIRNSNQIVLTISGKLFLEFAKKVAKDHKNFMDNISNDATGQIHSLRLGVLPLILEYDFMDIISRFQMVHEQIKIMLFEDNQFELLRMLEYGHLDAVIARSDFAPPYIYDLMPINRDILCVACSTNHRLTNKKSVSLQDVKAEQLAMIEEKSDIYQLLNKACIAEGFYPNIVFTSNRHGHLLEILNKNRSLISILPSRLIKIDQFSNLVSIPLKNSIYTTISLIRDKDSKNSSCLDAFTIWWQNELN